MDIKRIDGAIKAYGSRLDESDVARLGLFRGVWEIQARHEGLVAADHGYQVPSDLAALDAAYWDERPLFAQFPVKVEAGQLADTAVDIARYLVEHGALTNEAMLALTSCDFEKVIDRTDLSLAGSAPAAWLAQVADGGGLAAGEDIVCMVLALALRAILEPAQEAIDDVLHDRVVEENSYHTKLQTCPICGSEAAIAYVGPTESSAGNATRLYCSVCGNTWEFERIRCARCGCVDSAKLHYFNEAGDETHRVHLCENCGGYVRTCFVSKDSLVPYVPEVEDVVMAGLDAMAAAGAFDEAMGG